MNLTRSNKNVLIGSGVLLIGVLLFFGVRSWMYRNVDPDDVVIAKIGDSEITVKDFRLNYEFGLPNLKPGKNAAEMKRAYLNYMIYEKLLAQEGYKLNLDNTQRVLELKNEFLQEEMVKSILKYEVADKITVSPDEIKESVNKSSVSFKLNFWPSASYPEAARMREEMLNHGFMNTVNRIIKNEREVKVDTTVFQTKEISWLDIEPDLLDIIKDLPDGQISEPVLINNVYYLFQVNGIKRNAVMPEDYLNKAPSVKKVIYNTKLKAETFKFVSSYMTPKNVVTKGNLFIMLADALAEWKGDSIAGMYSFRDAVKNSTEKYPAMQKLKLNGRRVLTEFEGGELYLNNILDLLNVSNVKEDPRNQYPFRKQLNQQLAQTIRDYLLGREGFRRGYEKETWVKKEMKEWMDKWVFEETRHFFTDKINITDAEVNKYFYDHPEKFRTSKDEKPVLDKSSRAKATREASIAKDRNLLMTKIDSLKKHYKIEINYAVLDTLTVIQPKNKFSFLQAYQGGTGRLVVPIVDAAWGK